MNFRNLFARLANALINEGKRDSAIKVLNRCMEIMPEKTVPYNVFSIGLIENYYRVGEHQKAHNILLSMKNITEQELTYFLSLKPEHAKGLIFEARRAITVYNELLRIAKSNGEKELSKNMEEKLQIYTENFIKLYPNNTSMEEYEE